MYRIVYGTAQNLPDVAAFIETLNELRENPAPEARNIFDPGAELIVTRAPGRLDVMGGFADYSGSLVLELPLREATIVALQREPSRRLRIVSLVEDNSREPVFEMSLDELEINGRPIDYETARARFQREPRRHWAAYVAGVFLVLMRERKAAFTDGARILISSRVPEGKGVSSSAALEVSVMHAVETAFDLRLNPREGALLCQLVEKLVAGAPCGVMDQMTAMCGQSNRLLALLCQPAEPRDMIDIPDDLSLWGLDSGVRHAITGNDYASVRTGTFMGYRIIADVADLKVQPSPAGRGVEIEDPRWRGYLANLTPVEFEESYAAHLPERIGGAEFLCRFQGTTDAATRVVPEQGYAVRVPAAHAVYEHHRVRLYAELLRGAGGGRRNELMGELMYHSHGSYSECGLGCSSTDRLVQLVREAGPGQGLYGAKISGGGSGGTVVVLGRRDAETSIARVAGRYAEETGHSPQIFCGSSPGSAEFGFLRLKRNS
jgi:L-arabinokinase